MTTWLRQSSRLEHWHVSEPDTTGDRSLCDVAIGPDAVPWRRDGAPRVWVRCAACESIRLRQDRHARVTRRVGAEPDSNGEARSGRSPGRATDLRAILRRPPGG